MSSQFSILLALIFAVYISLVTASGGCSPPPAYDPWELINTQKGYIKYRNFNASEICFSARRLYTGYRIGLFNVSARTYADPTVRTAERIAQVKNCSDVVNIYDTEGAHNGKAKLVYAKSNFCGIFVLVASSTQSNCILWVTGLADGTDIKDCVTHSPAYCGTEKYDAFPSNICGPPP